MFNLLNQDYRFCANLVRVTSTLFFYSIVRLCCVGLLIFTIGCQKASFSAPSEAPGKTGATGDKQPDPTTQPGVGTTGGTGTPGTPTLVLPKAKFYAPPCMRLTDCLVEFTLDKAHTEVFGFIWATNDTIYLTAPAAGQPPYGKPNIDYVPASGAITFKPGEVKKQVYIKDISPNLNSINIVVDMSSCTFGTAALDCSTVF